MPDQVKISRKFGRTTVDCASVIALPAHHAEPRVKGRFFQIGKGGCGILTEAKLYIGEECLVWATRGGLKFLGIKGKIVWLKTVYLEREMTIVGIEFSETLDLTPKLLKDLGAKKPL